MNDQTISAVNYHLNRNCNMHCKFCFATFRDIDHANSRMEEHISIIKQCALAGIRKINFAGGEPTLLKHLPTLLRVSKELGMVTSIVTNGSRLLDEAVWRSVSRFLDILGLSVDSINEHLNVRSGRALNKNQQALTEESYFGLAEKARLEGIPVKLNTVVSNYNWQDDLSHFVREVAPVRWKIFQVLPILGQNDRYKEEYLITDSMFSKYIERHKAALPNVPIIAEENDLMMGSYLMISPDGRFFDNTKGTHSYSSPILESSFDYALSEIAVSKKKFLQREGEYFNKLA
ncbi:MULTISPECIES: viperin family antiviral radical SAM protein [unclassified Imperialibacter]|uniref:viperin family antiviral radical SAM protein n=1 Tax=unclassified Imperialibacter TaxID=2629706 RepID=UPI00125391BA|nr:MULTISPECIES: viperin family antiviral radical SAM protein [unclassified Imperialibacter]CAD5257367.1 Radical S-adenosyl methionine domain-containing protein 2 [Imperialibacter sp. 89]CAD5272355.1 Radical S-adenosyl methionine domain-containing protein 2 [Imperialibacter sp. 75]VVT32113.1 Radical S-adenosyl methionine domain-containing protein 2 [Imperialibacter sp. EC-SDR9]